MQNYYYKCTNETCNYIRKMTQTLIVGECPNCGQEDTHDSVNEVGEFDFNKQQNQMREMNKEGKLQDVSLLY